MSAAATNIKININDVWKDVDSVKINISDVWKDVTEVKINIGDTWKTVSGTLNGYIKTETWEGTAPTCNGVTWPDCKTGEPTDCMLPWHEWTPKDYDCDHTYLCEIQGTIKHSGTQSLKMVRVQGQGDTVDLHYTLPSAVTKLHVRMYIYFDSSWEDAHSGSNEEIIHFMFFNTAVAGSNFSVDIWNFTDQPYDENNYCPSGGDDGGIHFGFHSYYDDCVAPCNTNEMLKGPAGNNPPECWNIKDYMNEWHCHEFMWDLDNDKVKHWIDGDLTVDREMCACNHATITKIILSGWNSCGACQSAYEATYYVDDIILAESYIGT